MAHPEIDIRFPRLEVIVGCMCSSKTERLLYRLRQYSFSKENGVRIKTLLLRPKLDTRESKTHAGRKFEGTHVPVDATVDDLREVIGSEELDSIRVIGFDEGNFFDADTFVKLCTDLVSLNKIVIVAGLDLTFARDGYGAMPDLMLLSDVLDKTHAVCNECGSPYGTLTQRLIDGEPASKDSPQNIVGDENETETSQGVIQYLPVCRNCYRVAKEDQKDA